MDLYLEAWNDLTTTRSIGFSVGPIPWNTCQAWCGVRNYDLRTQQDVWEVIRRVDISMLEHWREVAEKQSK